MQVLASMLETTKFNTVPEDLVYTTGLLAAGQVQLNTQPVASFTQADIDAGWVTFEHSGSSSPTAGFGFTVTGVDGEYLFPITVLATDISVVINPVEISPVRAWRQAPFCSLSARFLTFTL